METIKEYFRYFWLSAPRFIAIGGAFILTPIFYANLGDEYHIYIYVTVLSVFGSVIGNAITVVRLRENGLVVYVRDLFFILFSVSCGFVIALLSSGDNYSHGVLIVAMVSAAALSFCIPFRSLFVSRGFSGLSSVVESVFICIRYAGLYVAIFFELDIDGFIIVYAASFLLEAFVYFLIFQFKFLKEGEGNSSESARIFDFAKIKSSVNVFLRTTAFQITEYLLANLDRILVAVLGFTEVLVLYTFAATVAACIYVVPAQINAHSLVKSFEKGVLLDEHIVMVIRRLLGLLLLSIIVFLFVGLELIEVWLGSVLSQQEVSDVFYSSVLLMGAYCCNLLSGPIIHAFVARSKQLFAAFVNILSMLVFLVLALVDNISTTNVAACMLLCFLFRFIVLAVSAKLFLLPNRAVN